LIASALPSLGWSEILLRLALAAALGGAIGIERELRDRYAGLRTHLLVSVGAALFTLVSAYAWRDFAFGNGVTFDPTRIAAQVVTGIGFLGAGAIMRHGVTVHGLTTAATLWVAAAIGMATAAGFYTAAVVTTVLALVVLWPLRIVERRYLDRLRTSSDQIVVGLVVGARVTSVIHFLEERRIVIASVHVEDAGDGQRTVVVDCGLASGTQVGEIVDDLLALEGVNAAQWLS